MRENFDFGFHYPHISGHFGLGYPELKQMSGILVKVILMKKPDIDEGLMVWTVRGAIAQRKFSDEAWLETAFEMYSYREDYVYCMNVDAEIVEADTQVEAKKEAYEDAKFAMPFDLKQIDNAEFELKKAEKVLADKKDDLKSRKALLKELF